MVSLGLVLQDTEESQEERATEHPGKCPTLLSWKVAGVPQNLCRGGPVTSGSAGRRQSFR